MSKLSRRHSVPHFNAYQKYKPYLREDFQYRCVYCSIHENEYSGPRGFTVEHFRPKSKFAHLINEYENLLYGCEVCNPFKGSDWPSDNPLVDGVGYIDPCEHDYDDHFRLNGFEVEGLTQVAAYMIERLHLNRRQLVKLRQKRFDENATHAKIVREFNEQLTIIDRAMDGGRLPQTSRQQLQEMKLTIMSQLNDVIAKWEQRWEPLYALDDYR